MVDSVNVSVAEYAPGRSGSLAPIACENPIATGPLDTGSARLRGTPVTPSGCTSVNGPLARCAGPETFRVASPAVETTFAVVVAM